MLSLLKLSDKPYNEYNQYVYVWLGIMLNIKFPSNQLVSYAYFTSPPFFFYRSFSKLFILSYILLFSTLLSIFLENFTTSSFLSWFCCFFGCSFLNRSLASLLSLLNSFSLNLGSSYSSPSWESSSELSVCLFEEYSLTCLVRGSIKLNPKAWQTISFKVLKQTK